NSMASFNSHRNCGAANAAAATRNRNTHTTKLSDMYSKDAAKREGRSQTRLDSSQAIKPAQRTQPRVDRGCSQLHTSGQTTSSLRYRCYRLPRLERGLGATHHQSRYRGKRASTQACWSYLR